MLGHMIVERDLATNIRQAAQRFPVVTLTGPRQSGKSTLWRDLRDMGGVRNRQAPGGRLMPWAELHEGDWRH